MRSGAENWYCYVQVDCANDADDKATRSTIGKIVRRAASGIAPTSFTSVVTELRAATGGSQHTPSSLLKKDSTSVDGKTHKQLP